MGTTATSTSGTVPTKVTSDFPGFDNFVSIDGARRSAKRGKSRPCSSPNVISQPLGLANESFVTMVTAF